jgi:hypothetical protein
LTALVLCVSTSSMSLASTAVSTHKHRLSRKQKSVARHRLQRLIQRKPGAILSKGFLNKAQALDLTLPLTLRLRRSDQGLFDDVLAVVWDSSTWAWPSAFMQLQPVIQGDPPPGGLVPLDGRATVDAQFGNDVSGYGGPGVVETTNGRRLAFNSQIAAPIAVTSLASCESPSAPGVTDPTIPAVRLTRMNLVAGQGTSGLLSLFGGTARVSLHVRLATTTQSLASDCTGSFGDLPPGDYTQGAAPTADDPIVPISFDAKFRVSPAIDADGQVRFGVLTLPADVVQPSTFARVSACIQQTASPPCTVYRFPARLSISQLSAEVVLGDQT